MKTNSKLTFLKCQYINNLRGHYAGIGPFMANKGEDEENKCNFFHPGTNQFATLYGHAAS
jgi:hypothetical protein